MPPLSQGCLSEGQRKSRLGLGRKMATWEDLWLRALHPHDGARGAVSCLACAGLTPPQQAHGVSEKGAGEATFSLLDLEPQSLL